MKKKTTNSKEAKKIICKHVFTLESPMEILYQLRKHVEEIQIKDTAYYVIANRLFRKSIKMGMENINQLNHMLEEGNIKIGESNLKDKETIEMWYRNMMANALKHWYTIAYNYERILKVSPREPYDRIIGNLTKKQIYNIKKFDVITTNNFGFRNEAGGSERAREEVRAEIIRFFDDYEVGRRFVAKIYLDKDIEKLKKARYESVLRNYQNDLEVGKRNVNKLKASDYNPRLVYFTEHNINEIRKFKV